MWQILQLDSSREWHHVCWLNCYLFQCSSIYCIFIATVLRSPRHSYTASAKACHSRVELCLHPASLTTAAYIPRTYLVNMTQVCAAHIDATLRFDSDGAARVNVNQAQAEAAEREVYNSAYHQCWTHLMRHPPRDFDVRRCGSAAAPETEVVIDSSLLTRLPLLLDVYMST